MRETTPNFWNKIKNQADIWFFFGFLITFTFSVRKVMFFYPMQGAFNEYTGIFLYASDIFLALTIFSFIFFILNNRTAYLSMSNNPFTHPPCSLYIYLPLLLVAISLISTIWSENQAISVYRSIKFFEGYLLYLYILFRFNPFQLFRACPAEAKRPGGVEQLKKQEKSHAQSQIEIVPRGTICGIESKNNITQLHNNCSTWNIFILLIITLGVFQSIIGIWQALAQHSIGLLWLKESIISQNVPGVAKIILDGHAYIRAYGLFPHPNILGGFLLFSIIITLLYKKYILPSLTKQKLFHVEQLKKQEKSHAQSQIEIVPRLPAGKAGGTIGNQIVRSIGLTSVIAKHSINHFSVEKLILYKLWLVHSILFTQCLALLLTFSKSAIIGLLISLSYITIKTKCSTPACRRGRWNNICIGIKNSWLLIKNRIVPRGTIPDGIIPTKPTINIPKLLQVYPAGAKRLGGVEHFKKIALSIFIIITLILVTKPDINSLLFKSLGERAYYLDISRVLIMQNPFLGVGMGQFISNIPLYTKNAVESWQFQPVHNVFLLIWSELGIIGFLLFIFFLWKLFHARPPMRQMEQLEIVPRGTIQDSSLKGKGLMQSNIILCNGCDELSIDIILIHFQGILLGFIFIMLFDHYLWDIWPGQTLFWLVAGLIVGLRRKC